MTYILSFAGVYLIMSTIHIFGIVFFGPPCILSYRHDLLCTDTSKITISAVCFVTDKLPEEELMARKLGNKTALIVIFDVCINFNISVHRTMLLTIFHYDLLCSPLTSRRCGNSTANSRRSRRLRRRRWSAHNTY